MSEEELQEQKSYALRTEIEDKLGELAELWGPEDTMEFVQGLVSRMREEIAAMQDHEEGA